MRLLPRSGSFHSTFTADGEVPNATTTNHKNVPQDSRQKGVLRKVTWSQRCLVRVIPRIADMSEEEITLAYYTKEDTKRIQEDIAETAFLMKHGAAESDDITFRGLERKRAGEARRRRLHRMMVCRAVMAAAAEIQACGDKDEEHDEAIGQTCRLLTVSCTVAALERAAHDAREVNQSPLPTPSYGFSPSYEEETLAVPLALSSMVPVAVVCKGSH